MSAFSEGAAAAPPSTQRPSPQAQITPGNGGGANQQQQSQPQQQQQQQVPQMGFVGYPGQQLHRGSMQGAGMNMQMQGGPGGRGPAFMHQSPAQGHRNSIPGSMPPPMNMSPMNMGHQFPNQGGYNPNFNPTQQVQLHQFPNQGGYNPNFHPNGQQPPQQQSNSVAPQQYGQPNYSRQPSNSSQRNFHPNPQQPSHPSQQQQPAHPNQQQPPQQYRQPSNASGPVPNQPDGQSSGPLNFNSAPNLNGAPSSGDLGPGGDGQQFLPCGLNGDWQSDNDMHHRREMIQHIVKLLKQKDKNASPEWLTKLPQMVKQLEVSLYRSAPSFEEYSDTTTLKTRLQQLAMEIAKKTNETKDDPPGSDSQYPGQNPLGDGGGQQGSGVNSNNPMGGGNYGSLPSSGNGRGDNDPSGAGGSDSFSNQHGNPHDPDWKVRIRHKQQRLLLLHHSSKCPYEDRECKVTPYCSEMKKLWKHMARCTDNECRVPHCFSSRSILSHYRKCKDPRCPACGPVRETVRKTQKNQRRSSQQHGGGGPDAAGGMGNGINFGMPDPMGGNQIGGGQMLQSMGNMGMPMIGSNNGSMGQQMSAGPMDGMMNGSANPGSMQPNVFPGQQMSSMPPQQGENQVNKNGAMPPPPSSNDPNNNNDKAEHDAKARHKRQRLLLLRHASKCTAENGQCTATPHCAEMKVLWKHIANCKDSVCKVRHCMSSRYVLSHYRRCKPPCNICDPVKEKIKNGFNSHIEVDPAIMDGGAAGGVRTPPPVDGEPQAKRYKAEHNSSGPPSSHMAPPQSSNQGQRMAVPSSGSANHPSSKQQSSKPDDDSLLESFTTEQVKTHIQSLKKYAVLTPNELKNKCVDILKGLQTHEHGWVFATPVNPVELGLDDYFEIIKKPMDLGTIQKKLDVGSYHSFEEFKSDVRLTFENAMKYNEERTVVHEMAKELKKKFEVDFKKLMKQLDKEHAENSKKVQACGLCGCEKLNFEPPVFFCNGLNCPTKRIRRNTHFYITTDKQYAWCNQCFSELKGDTIDCGTTTRVKKAELTKRKNDEVHEESWVQCDDCERWIHQICGLYNTRQDKENTSAYSCPLCLLDKRKKAETDSTKLPEAPNANDIPRTKLSDKLEKDVHKKVEVRMKELAEEKAESENISYEKAYKALAVGGPLTIRQVTSTDRKHEVRDLMKARYSHKDYPEEFPYRCKCIVVFQNIDGVDVVLFALYVYEHAEDNPLPNKRTVYVSYLDSVHFMKPRQMRTLIYHEILISYLDHARERGFEQAFIWACPPLKGDDYIFYAKPEDQKTPKDVRLRQWYLDMLEDCQRRNIVGKVSNMYDEYFNNKSLDASAVPYFEGDYFPGEAENIIKELNDEISKGGKKKASSSKSKKSSDATNGSSSDATCYKEGGPDPVMDKFCEAISGMKESFIVAYFNCKDAKPENLVVPKEITEHRESNKLLENVKTDEDSKKSDDEKQVDRLGRPIRVLDDDVEEIDCEFFNTRQCFLDLCRGNHYQFDELRRAKHTSMMVLWHLQNREAPKFVQQCFACAREISSGVRHHCNVCPDFDLCHDCFRDPNANRGQCNHKLETVKVDTGAASTGLTEEQRKERQRNIQLHIALIEHASRCTSSKCTSSNCQKMKSYLKHGLTCKIKATGGCKVCKRIWTLLRIHAQQCKSSSCPIPQCIAIRKRIRQLQLKQRAMDDRRRQEMNRHYRMGMMSSSSS